ncbi:MAG: polyphosphate polymerase domain-containing protein [Lachnospiraceae bacterium]
MNDQMIFKRYELKFLLNKAQLDKIKEAMKDHMAADKHGKNTIYSLYYDTPDYRLIRHSIEAPIYKEKLRLRSYGTATPDMPVFVELKKKYESIVYKRRIGMSEKEASAYLSDKSSEINKLPKKSTSFSDEQITKEIDYCFTMYPELAPRVLLTYEREAFYGKEDHEFRMTFDSNILWRDYDLSLCKPVYGTPILKPGQTLMEIKVSHAIPMWLVKTLSENHIYKTSFSKYGNAYQAIYKNQQNGGNYHYA